MSVNSQYNCENFCNYNPLGNIIPINESFENQNSIYEDYSVSERYNPAQDQQYENRVIPDYSNDTQEMSELRSEFNEAKNNQGIISIFGDMLNNITGAETSTINIENAINSLDESSTQEEIKQVQDLIDAYDKDESFVEAAGTGAAMGVGGLAGMKAGAAVGTAACPVLGTAAGAVVGLVVGAAAGALTNVAINQVDKATDGEEGNFCQGEDLAQEAVSGGKSGATGYAIGATAEAVSFLMNGMMEVGSAAKEAVIDIGSNILASTTVTEGRYATDCALGEQTLTSSGLINNFISSFGGGAFFGATGSNAFMNYVMKLFAR